MRVVTIHQAKTNLSRLIKKASRGEEAVIARGSKPVARLVPIGEVKEKRQPGSRLRPGRLPPKCGLGNWRLRRIWPPISLAIWKEKALKCWPSPASTPFAPVCFLAPPKDSFDRMLIAQAQAENMPIVSNEVVFDAHGVRRIW